VRRGVLVVVLAYLGGSSAFDPTRGMPQNWNAFQFSTTGCSDGPVPA